MAADFTRREEGVLTVEEDLGDGESGRLGCRWEVWLRCARADCRCDIDPGVTLPDFEPAPPRKRDMPSEGIESLPPNVDSRLLVKAGEPLEPLGVMVAEMFEVLGAAL